MANRFGISALSKDKYMEAYNEEILVDKSVGEFLIKTPTGEIVSYNRTARLSSVYDNIRRVMRNSNYYGDLYTAENDSLLPKVLNIASNTTEHNLDFIIYIKDPNNTTENDVKELKLYIDVDFLEKSNKESQFLTATYRDNIDNTVLVDIASSFTTNDDGTIEPIFDRTMSTICNSANPACGGTISVGLETPIYAIRVKKIIVGLSQITSRPQFMIINYVGAIAKA